MKVLVVTIVLILSGTISSFSQTKTFTWEFDLCRFQGTYDSAKYSEKELRDTQKLMASIGSLSLMTQATASKIGDEDKLDVAKLSGEYYTELEKLKALKVVKKPYWQKLKRDRIIELKQYYQMAKTSMEAYDNPSVLKTYKGADSCVDFYAPPLIKGGDYLMATWLKVNMDSRDGNGNPSAVKARFEREKASPDRMRYARIEVMNFGWWNCANKARKHVEGDGRLYDEYIALFKKVKEDCDEPE